MLDLFFFLYQQHIRKVWYFFLLGIEEIEEGKKYRKDYNKGVD
jgi:hypothetical protein